MDDQRKKINSIVAKIKKQEGEESVVTLSDEGSIRTIEAISTGIPLLDLTIGIGGFPKGRIIELFGVEGGGKSSIALYTIASLQKRGGICGYIDLEQAINIDYASQLGVNVDELIISQPSSGDEGLRITEKLIQEGVDLVVIDSIASFVTEGELKKDIADPNVATVARVMSQALKRLAYVVANAKSCLICINQVREKPGVMFGNPETTPGGRALKYYSSVRLQVNKSETLKTEKSEGEIPYGDILKIKIVKNKVAPPFRNCQVTHIWGKGFDDSIGIVQKAIERHVIENPKQGSYVVPVLNEGFKVMREVRGLESVYAEVGTKESDNYKLLLELLINKPVDIPGPKVREVAESEGETAEEEFK
jgi:recombination protein RecA